MLAVVPVAMLGLIMVGGQLEMVSQVSGLEICLYIVIENSMKHVMQHVVPKPL